MTKQITLFDIACKFQEVRDNREERRELLELAMMFGWTINDIAKVLQGA